MRRLERGDATAAGLWRPLADPPHLDAQIAVERRVLGHLREGERLLSDPAALGTSNRIGLARDQFRAALREARAGHDATNAAYSVPQCLYALGRGEWAYARTLQRDGAEGAERRAALSVARAAFEEIVRAYPWRAADDPAGAFPTRREAPHAHVPIAFRIVDEADPESVAEYNGAVDQARSWLERLRRTCVKFWPVGKF
jgi:hypothetical protein